MGCASSAALPFLTNRGNQAVSETPRMNGELKMVNNKLKENGLSNVKDINESFVSEKMKEVVDSSAVQGAIEGVVHAKDDIVNQVQGIGQTISEKVTSAVDGVEDTIEATFGKLTKTVGSMEDKVKSEVESIGDDINSALDDTANEANAVKDSMKKDIDELLDSLPTEEEVKTAAEEMVEKAVEEVKEEVDN